MKTENFFLILGLLFSIILITFRIENGFEYINTEFQFSVIDIALNKSNKTYLDSSMIGYLCYLVFSLIMWKKTNVNGKYLLLIFSFLSLIGLTFEMKSFYESLNGIYNGAHFRIGILLVFLGFYIVNRTKKEMNK